MTMQTFKKALEENIKGRIRPEDFVEFHSFEGSESISIVPHEFKQRVRPYIPLSEYFKLHEEGKADIDSISAHLVGEMISLWQYAVENDISCPCCGDHEETSYIS